MPVSMLFPMVLRWRDWPLSAHRNGLSGDLIDQHKSLCYKELKCNKSAIVRLSWFFDDPELRYLHPTENIMTQLRETDISIDVMACETVD